MQEAARYKITFIIVFLLISVSPLMRYAEMPYLSLPANDERPLPVDLQKEAQYISTKYALPIPKGGIWVVSYEEDFLGAYVLRDEKILLNEDVVGAYLFVPVLIHELAHANDSHYMAAGLILHIPLSLILSVILTKLMIITDKGKKHIVISGFLVMAFVLIFYFSLYATKGYSPLTILQEVRANYVVGICVGYWRCFIMNIAEIFKILIVVAAAALVTCSLDKMLKEELYISRKRGTRQGASFALSSG